MPCKSDRIPRVLDIPNTRFDTTDPGGTYRPNEPPEAKRGTQFKPFGIEARQPTIRYLPDTPLDIFQLFIPESLVQRWVEYTNEAAASMIDEETLPKAR